MGRVYAVASGKGGVGKTTTVANLGATLAAGGHETAVVDADLGMGNLANALGIDPDDGPTVHDVLAGTASVDEAAREGPNGLTVLPGSTDIDAFGDAAPANLSALVDDVDADVVLLDTSAGLSHDSVEPLQVADEVLLVSTAERAALADTRKTREVTDRLGTPVAGVVVTRVIEGTDLDAVADRLGVEVRGAVPEDPAVAAAAEAGRPLLADAPGAPATLAYRRLAAELTGDASLEPDESAAGGEDSVEVPDAEEASTEGEEHPDDAEGAEAAEPPGEEDGETADEGEKEEKEEKEEEAMPSATAAAAADPRRTPGEDDSVADRIQPASDLGTDDEGDDGVSVESDEGGRDETADVEAESESDVSVETDDDEDDGGRSGFLAWLFR